MFKPLSPTMNKTPHITILLSIASFSTSFLSATESQACAKFNLSDTANFVDERLATQTINSRDNDPFGLPQNPDKKPTSTHDVPEVVECYLGEGKKPQLKLQVNKLRGRVSVRGNSFLLGNRYFKVADQLSIKDGESLFNLEVTSVRKNVIQFRDLKSNELLKLNLKQSARQLPKGDQLPDIPLSTGDKAIEL